MFCCSWFAGCGGNDKSQAFDSPTQGKINISVDESFKPVIEEHIKVFETSFPNTEIIAHYKPEAECLKDLFTDSATRMVIVTRGLSYKEERYFKDSLTYLPETKMIASDAVTIVVNKKSTDTLFTLDRLKKQLSGKMKNNEVMVFDGLNATSTIRYARDSILGGMPFDTSIVKAVKTSRDVLEYVASNENAIGFVGLSWIGNPEDTAQVNMLKKVKMAYVQCDRCEDSPYVKPTQLGILSDRYPLVRGLYYMLKENFNGLGSGFAGFLQYERGQLIFKRAYLGTRMGFGIRNVRIKKI
jgi:phosphate transport system substrate-binding protein